MYVQHGVLINVYSNQYTFKVPFYIYIYVCVCVCVCVHLHDHRYEVHTLEVFNRNKIR